MDVRNPRWLPANSNTYISTCIQLCCMIQTGISMFLKSRYSKKLFFILFDASGSQKSKMSDPQTGNTCIIACTQSSWTSISFSGSKYSNKLFFYIVWYKQKPEFQDGGSQTGNTYISAFIQRSCQIPTAIPTCSKAKNSLKLFSTMCDK